MRYGAVINSSLHFEILIYSLHCVSLAFKHYVLSVIKLNHIFHIINSSDKKKAHKSDENGHTGTYIGHFALLSKDAIVDWPLPRLSDFFLVTTCTKNILISTRFFSLKYEKYSRSYEIFPRYYEKYSRW